MTPLVVEVPENATVRLRITAIQLGSEPATLHFSVGGNKVTSSELDRSSPDKIRVNEAIFETDKIGSEYDVKCGGGDVGKVRVR